MVSCCLPLRWLIVTQQAQHISQDDPKAGIVAMCNMIMQSIVLHLKLRLEGNMLLLAVTASSRVVVPRIIQRPNLLHALLVI